MTSRAVAIALPAAEPSWLRWLLAATLVFNLVDGILTLLVVSMGAAEEVNPLMAVALEAGPVSFMALKLAIVSAGIACLWSQRHKRLAHLGGVAVFLVYTAVTAWHVQSVEALAELLRAAA